MKNNKYKPMEMGLPPRRVKKYFKLLINILLKVYCPKSMKINYIGFDGIKEPSIIISNHHSFLDFPNMIKVIKPFEAISVCSIEEFIGREWLLRSVGAYPKRKFTNDIGVPRSVYTIINRYKQCAILFPEARYSFVGRTERIDKALGKLVKFAKCPVYVLIQKGNHLRCPQYDQKKYRKVLQEIDVYQIATKEEVLALSQEEIQARIEEKFVFDEYKWQRENKIINNSKIRCRNIHKVLYKCPVCGCEEEMTSNGTSFTCNNCHTTWNMDEYGVISQVGGEARFTSATDWYDWERSEVYKEVNAGTFVYEDVCELKHLVNCKIGLKRIGDVTLRQDNSGIHVKGILDDGSEFSLEKTPQLTPSLHIDFNLRTTGGAAIDLNTLEDTWFAYPKSKKCIKTLMKLNFSTEAIADLANKEVE